MELQRKNMKKQIALLIYIVTGLISTQAFAETLYVTDRILLGVHQQAAEESPLITSIPSGTPVTVLEKGDNFLKVKLADGTEGWVSNNYLKKEKPATAEMDTAYAKLQKEQETNKKLSENLTKVERELQVRRDEASNFKTTIKELRKKLKDGSSGQPVVDDSALKEANEQISKLQEQITKLEQEKNNITEQQNSAPAETDMDKLLVQNQEFQVRIEAALANLKGEKVPTAAELAAIRPSFPFWYWLLLVALFIAGIAGGIGWFDFQHRKKHGGFRI